MGVFTLSPNVLTYENSGLNLAGGYSSPAWDQTLTQTTYAPSSIVSFDLNGGGIWVNTFTAASTPYQTGGPVASGTVGSGATIANGDTINMDMSSFFWNWNGNTEAQGSSAATGTVSGVSGNHFDYTLTWTSIFNGGATNGQTGTWQFTGTGTVAPVPLPAASWLLASGFAGLLGIARRRRQRM